MGRARNGLPAILTEVARTAARLCQARDCLIFLADGDQLRLVAKHGTVRYPRDLGKTRPLNRRNPLGRAIVDRRTVHVRDLAAALRQFPESLAAQQATEVRTLVATPLLCDGAVVGGIVVRRTVVRPFTSQQISLLKTFADQAAIAIANTRLAEALAARNQELTEALERETATGEILRVISGSPTKVQPVLDAVAESAARLCTAYDAVIYRRDGDLLRRVAHHGPIPVLPSAVVHAARGSISGRAVLEQRPIHVADLQAETEEFPEGAALARQLGFRTVLSVPLMRESVAIGTIAIRRTEIRPFTEQQVALLRTFADQAVIAIENVRLFTQLQASNRELTEALDRQTSTAEILQAISQAQTDIQPVFEAIADSAMRLFRAWSVLVFRYESELIRLTAARGGLPGSSESFMKQFQEPRHATEDTPPGRAALTRTVQHVTDVATDPAWGPRLREDARARGFRSVVAVPLLRGGDVVGVFAVTRDHVGGFAPAEIALLQTFANQAVIAVENARLLTELQARNRDLTEALEQQTATSEILRAISSSPTDIQPVLDAVVHNASRLCDAKDAQLFRIDGEVLRLAASFRGGDVPVSAEVRAHGVPLQRGTVTGRSVLDRRAIHVHDIVAELDTEYPGARVFQLATNMRTVLAVPLLRENDALGAILIRRFDVRPFSEKQVTLLQTFADQAVIAIENVRLFTALQASNRELTEALEQQTATAEILRAISSSPTDTQPIFDVIVRNAANLCDALYGLVFRHDAGLLHLVAHHNLTADQLAEYHRVFPRPVTASPLGRATMSGHVLNIPDVESYPEAPPESLALWRSRGVRSILSVPLHRQTEVVGQIGLSHRAVGAFTDGHVELLKTFADQAVIAIENVRLFTELQTRNRELSEALEQQTATGEILRVISSSPTDVQPILDTIAEHSARLCGALFSSVYRFDGELIHMGAHHNYPPLALERSNQFFPARPSRKFFTARAILERAVIHVPDVEQDREYAVLDYLREIGFRSVLSVPMLRDGEPIGAITVWRERVGSFTDKQIALLQTFADQAVIAIENVRLFNELQARTRELTRSVEQLRALSDVSHAVSSTLDLDTVLTTIVARANQLAGTDGCTVYEYDAQAEEFRFRATHNQDEGLVAIARARPIHKGEGVVGRLAVTREPVQIPDILAEGAYESPFRSAVVRSGARALLALPLECLERGGPASLRGEEQLIGALAVTRKTPGEFPTATIDLLKTFATQSALAIHNARLFREIEDQSRQLEVASRHKSQFLANMSHELRTPLNAILGYTELIGDNIYGEVPEKMREVVERVEKSGRHLLGLINDILDLSKIEAGQLTLALNEYAMQDVVRSVAAATEPLARAKGLGLEVAVPDDLPIGRADERRLMQVVLNLVGNAIKFTEAGKVAIRAEVTDDDFRVAVADTGPGIAEGDREKIFEEFQQADSVVARAKGGTGLGLAIARRIIEMHGGRLWLESTLGVGSTFSFTVPVRVAQQVAAAPRRPAS
jgi:GAF domain-containing protein